MDVSTRVAHTSGEPRGLDDHEGVVPGAARPAETFGDRAGESSSVLDDLTTAEELARCLKVPKSTILDYQRRGVLPSVRLGKHVRFVRSDVEATIVAMAPQGRPRRRATALR
jgi:excisionase family DNA binding protein